LIALIAVSTNAFSSPGFDRDCDGRFQCALQRFRRGAQQRVLLIEVRIQLVSLRQRTALFLFSIVNVQPLLPAVFLRPGHQLPLVDLAEPVSDRHYEAVITARRPKVSIDTEDVFTPRQLLRIRLLRFPDLCHDVHAFGNALQPRRDVDAVT
jgi:hypothetical protein